MHADPQTSGQFLILVAIAAVAVIAKEMTIGVMLAFLTYRSSFMYSATPLIDQAERWRLLSVHLERLSDIVSERREEIFFSSLRSREGCCSIASLSACDHDQLARTDQRRLAG